uniref:Uncharacterized protein n=1 Tax=Oryza meridionalis TaxID=40149 RepID=A0A0E0C4D7_9ORYZ
MAISPAQACDAPPPLPDG